MLWKVHGISRLPNAPAAPCHPPLRFRSAESPSLCAFYQRQSFKTSGKMARWGSFYVLSKCIGVTLVGGDSYMGVSQKPFLVATRPFLEPGPLSTLACSWFCFPSEVFQNRTSQFHRETQVRTLRPPLCESPWARAPLSLIPASSHTQAVCCSGGGGGPPASKYTPIQPLLTPPATPSPRRLISDADEAPALGFSREAEPVGWVQMCTEIHSKELAHSYGGRQVSRSQDPPACWLETQKADVLGRV